jgi:hypothetical protein
MLPDSMRSVWHESSSRVPVAAPLCNSFFCVRVRWSLPEPALSSADASAPPSANEPLMLADSEDGRFELSRSDDFCDEGCCEA